MEKLEGITTLYRVEKNEEKNGLELYFEGIPNYKERQILKAQGYKWHNIKKCWYIRIDKQNKSIKKTKEIKRNHSLKVGDILEASWGYEQTNNTFYRVEELKGASMVIVREVNLAIKEREATGPDAENRSYDVKNWSYSTINKKPITRKVKNFYEDKRPEGDCIEPESYSIAHKYNGEKIYCSWYY